MDDRQSTRRSFVLHPQAVVGRIFMSLLTYGKLPRKTYRALAFRHRRIYPFPYRCILQPNYNHNYFWDKSRHGFYPNRPPIRLTAVYRHLQADSEAQTIGLEPIRHQR